MRTLWFPYLQQLQGGGWCQPQLENLHKYMVISFYRIILYTGVCIYRDAAPAPTGVTDVSVARIHELTVRGYGHLSRQHRGTVLTNEIENL